MALDVRPMIADRTEAARLRIIDTRAASVIFAASAGGETLPKGTVVSFNTATELWVPWVTAGVNGTGTVKGIVLNDKTDPLVLDATNTVVGVVMLAGEAHRDDLQSVALGLGADAPLDASLQSDARSIGIYVRSLEKIR